MAVKLSLIIFAVLQKNAALVKGLRRLPFTEESRVRFPYVVQKALQQCGAFLFFIIITVYFLLSKKDNATYARMALNALTRLKEHNDGKNRYTKAHLPWTIIYKEENPDWASARLREKYFKSTAGKSWLRKYFDNNRGVTGSLPA